DTRKRILAQVVERALRVASPEPAGSTGIRKSGFLPRIVERAIQRRRTQGIDLAGLSLGALEAEQGLHTRKSFGAGLLVGREVGAGRIELAACLAHTRHCSVMLKL